MNNTLTVRYWWTHGEHHRSRLAALLRRVQWHAALAPWAFGKRP